MSLESGDRVWVYRGDWDKALNDLHLVRTELAALRAAAEALENKLKVVEMSPRYIAVWSVAQDLLGPYDGPKYEAELHGLRIQLRGVQ